MRPFPKGPPPWWMRLRLLLREWADEWADRWTRWMWGLRQRWDALREMFQLPTPVPRPLTIPPFNWGNIFTGLSLLAVPAAIFLVFMAIRFRELLFAEAMECAQIARNLAQGKGFVTDCLRPLELAFNDSWGNHPDLTYPPLFPLLLAFFFQRLGAGDNIAALVSGLFYILTLGVTLLFAWRMLGKRAAIYAFLFTTVNLPLIWQSISGMPLTLFAFLLTLLCFLLYLSPREIPLEVDEEGEPLRVGYGSPLLAAACGLVFGLGVLTKYGFAFFALPVLVYLWLTHTHTRGWSLVAFSLVALAVVSPWLYRNYLLMGNPFFTLRWYEIPMHTTVYPGASLYRRILDYPPSPLGFMFGHVRTMGRKVVEISAGGLYMFLPMVPSVFLFPFFLVGMFLPPEDRAYRFLRPCVYTMLIFQTLLICLTSPVMPNLIPFVPLMVLLATDTFLGLLDWWLGEEWRWTKSIVIALLCFFVFYPLFGQLALGVQIPPNPSEEDFEYIRTHVPQGAVLISDMPWSVAWHAERTALWLPQWLPDFQELQRRKKVQYIHLSQQIRTYPRAEEMHYWQTLYYRKILPTGFRLGEEFEGGGVVLVAEKPAPD